MKAYLMYRREDFDVAQKPPPQAAALVQDLELATLFAAMAHGDKWLAAVVAKAVLASSADLDTIRYRQAILKDCLKNEALVRGVYSLSVETIESERKNFWSSSGYPNGILHRSVGVLQMLLGMLQRLRAIADKHLEDFESQGFRTLFTMLRDELSDEYFATIRHHLRQLQFRKGVLISAQLGEGNKGIAYVLREENPPEGSWLDRLLTPGPPSHSFELAPRDDNGARALSDLRDQGVNLVANALAQSTDHIVSFFNMLRTELAFYVGCLNLFGQLSAQGEPVCFPDPVALGERRHTATGLYDVCLALSLHGTVIGNEVNADGKDLLIITGANQGGKSTFLRSIGLAQLMMQCGMFVPADTYRANVCSHIFTHYKREEDASMSSGKFDEELSRMSAIVESITPESLVLFNESFASTNEREGSEIARQIVTALLERQMKVVFVTHQYEFAHGFRERNLPSAQFLRAERRTDGARTFRIIQADPMTTSFGEDLYKQIFLGAPRHDASAAAEVPSDSGSQGADTSALSAR